MSNIRFRDYEGVLLLDALIDVEAGNISEDHAVAKVSDQLRRIAKNNGEFVDESFRSKSGIFGRMSNLKYIWTDGRFGTENATDWCARVVNMYRRERDRFDTLLRQAKDMASQNDSSDEQETEDFTLLPFDDLEDTTPYRNETIRVDFTGDQSYSYTRPVFLNYFGDRYDVETWKALYIQTVRCLYDDYPDELNALKGKSILEAGRRIDFGDWLLSRVMRDPIEIADDLYLETNAGADAIVTKISALLGACRVDDENVEIICRPYENPTIRERSSGDEREFATVTAPDSLFYLWLTQKQGLEESDARALESAVENADLYVRSQSIGYGMILGTLDMEAIRDTFEALINSQEFLAESISEMDRYWRALTHYLSFMQEVNENLMRPQSTLGDFSMLDPDGLIDEEIEEDADEGELEDEVLDKMKQLDSQEKRQSFMDGLLTAMGCREMMDMILASYEKLDKEIQEIVPLKYADAADNEES